MKLIELATPVIAEALSHSQQPDRDRSALHVSDIIRHIENTVTKPGQRPSRSDMSKEELRRMGNYAQMGFVWEQLVRDALAPLLYDAHGHELVSPGPVERDGIVGTPDRLDLANESVEETKATWRSSRRPIDTDFWPWWVQIKAYCHMLRVQSATLPVFFVNGDYRNSGPQMRKWYAEFTREELEMNWDMLKRAGEEMTRAKTT